ncbi:MAG: histidine kinase [Salinivirgaceae bacterium]|nr:histidine kinase [Salinivirgaceae bacterium]
MKYLFIFLLNSFLGFALFIYIFFSFNSEFPSISFYSYPYLFSIIVSNIIGFSIWAASIVMNKLWNWKQIPLLKILSNLTLFTCISWVLAQLLIPFFINNYFFIIGNPIAEIDYTNIFLKFTILSFNLILVYVLSDYLIFSYKNYIYRKIKVIEEQKERSQLQLEMLQKQLSPHYLFNSLNTISSLLESSAKITEKYIRKLVNTYQYILSISNKELVTVADELKMIKAYQFQLEVRFGANIHWKYRIDNKVLNYLLPPLSLQILVENAVKHNIASKENPLNISISSNDNYLKVKNNITENSEKPISHKIGLKNLKKRYALIGNYDVKTFSDKNFEAHLPLLSHLNYKK